MGYGSTYSREPTKEEISEKESLVSCLCHEAGYNRENLEGIELEAKIDIVPSCFLRKLEKNPPLTLGEDLQFQEPYSRDEIFLQSSLANHTCYAFVDKKRSNLFYQEKRNWIPAFTKVDGGGGEVKIKLKEEAQKIEENGIVLLKRREKYFKSLSAIEVNKQISKIARQSNLPLEYLGTFSKKSKETFVFNPASGRIFVVATNLCNIEENPNRLYQLEIEYYGQINGFTASRKIEKEMAELVRETINSLPKGYSGHNSVFTKFDWLMKNTK